jgi:hypothetical protein
MPTNSQAITTEAVELGSVLAGAEELGCGFISKEG